jgi:hypothetical protein
LAVNLSKPMAGHAVNPMGVGGLKNDIQTFLFFHTWQSLLLKKDYCFIFIAIFFCDILVVKNEDLTFMLLLMAINYRQVISDPVFIINTFQKP